MKDFFYDMLIETFKDGGMSILIGIIMWISMLLIIGFILFGGLYAVDYIGRYEKQGVGVVINKYIEPAHTITSFVMVGKIMVPQTHNYPDVWYATIKINDRKDNVSFDEHIWYKLEIKQNVNCTYKSGIIFKSIYIKKVSL